MMQFCWNIKRLEVVGQIQLSNKCMKEMFLLKMKTHFLWKTYKIFCLKELSRAINWGQLSRERLLEGQLPWGNYPGGNYPGANCPVAIIREQLSGGGNCPEAIVLEPKCVTYKITWNRFWREQFLQKLYYKYWTHLASLLCFNKHSTFEPSSSFNDNTS